ncbi:hypothetical protein T310_8677, partial [Rasamsonia emersonii CBS 393.64]
HPVVTGSSGYVRTSYYATGNGVLPPCIHTTTGNLASCLVPRARAILKLRQFSLMFTTRLVNGNTSPVPCGHQAPGCVASMTDPLAGLTGTGGAKRRLPDVSSA